METFQHDPDDTAVDYKISYDTNGDTLTASTWIVPVGLTVVDSEFGADWARVWIRGGTKGTRYKVTNRYTLAAGGQRDRSFYLVVRDA